MRLALLQTQHEVLFVGRAVVEVVVRVAEHAVALVLVDRAGQPLEHLVRARTAAGGGHFGGTVGALVGQAVAHLRGEHVTGAATGRRGRRRRGSGRRGGPALRRRLLSRRAGRGRGGTRPVGAPGGQ